MKNKIYIQTFNSKGTQAGRVLYTSSLNKGLDKVFNEYDIQKVPGRTYDKFQTLWLPKKDIEEIPSKFLFKEDKDTFTLFFYTWNRMYLIFIRDLENKEKDIENLKKEALRRL